MSILQSKKYLDYKNDLIVCDCGKWQDLEIFYTYNYLSLFFIPIFKFNRKFFVYYKCCKILYSLDNEVGMNLLRGNDIKITKEDLSLINASNVCSCGYTLDREFSFCPHCGRKL